MKKTAVTILTIPTLLLIAFAASCAPAPAPVYFPTLMPTAISALPVTEAVETYYKLINDAQSMGDLGKPWDLLTNEEQCNPKDKCDLSYFQSEWWQWKVTYKIYECGFNQVVAEERLYPREADLSLARPARFVQFQLIQGDEKVFISDRKTLSALEPNCALAIDSSASP